MEGTTVTQTRQRLKDMILDGSLFAGQHLRQDELARMLGVSRTPLREALAMLAAEGLVQMNPRRSATVFRPSKKELEELYEIRILLECEAIRKAAVVFPRREVQRLSNLLQRMDTVDNTAAFNAFNWKFHDACYAPCNQGRLLELIARVRGQSAPYSEIVLGRGLERENAQTDHRNLLAALKDRDPDRASELVALHLQTTIDVVKLELDARFGPAKILARPPPRSLFHD
jgi:DNA-binding GntR family transcriptional regulator